MILSLKMKAHLLTSSSFSLIMAFRSSNSCLFIAFAFSRLKYMTMTQCQNGLMCCYSQLYILMFFHRINAGIRLNNSFRLWNYTWALHGISLCNQMNNFLTKSAADYVICIFHLQTKYKCGLTHFHLRQY